MPRTLALLALAACTYDVEAYQQDYVEAWCEAYDDCQVLAGTSGVCPLEAPADNDGALACDFSASDARRCLRAVRAAPCDEGEPVVEVEACEAACGG